MSETNTSCANCGTELDEAPGLAVEARPPCPVCGLTARNIRVEVPTATVKIEALPPTIAIRQVWDGNSLTLFGVLYGILVTVAGVVVAVEAPHPVAMAVYAIASVAVLTLCLLVFPQYVIAAMRGLVDRAKHAPPRTIR